MYTAPAEARSFSGNSAVTSRVTTIMDDNVAPMPRKIRVAAP